MFILIQHLKKWKIGIGLSIKLMSNLVERIIIYVGNNISILLIINIISNNCHSHCAYALNSMNYQDYNQYNMIFIWWYCLTRSKYVSWFHILKTYFGFIIIVLIIFFLRLYSRR